MGAPWRRVCANPGTSVEALIDILAVADLVLVMSVNPGFGGQQFITNSLRKVARLVELRKELTAEFMIQVDGGVNNLTGAKLVEAGVDSLVAGNFVFDSPNPQEKIKMLKEL